MVWDSFFLHLHFNRCTPNNVFVLVYQLLFYFGILNIFTLLFLFFISVVSFFFCLILRSTLFFVLSSHVLYNTSHLKAGKKQNENCMCYVVSSLMSCLVCSFLFDSLEWRVYFNLIFFIFHLFLFAVWNTFSGNIQLEPIYFDDWIKLEHCDLCMAKNVSVLLVCAYARALSIFILTSSLAKFENSTEFKTEPTDNMNFFLFFFKSQTEHCLYVCARIHGLSALSVRSDCSVLEVRACLCAIFCVCVSLWTFTQWINEWWWECEREKRLCVVCQFSIVCGTHSYIHTHTMADNWIDIEIAFIMVYIEMFHRKTRTYSVCAHTHTHKYK